MAITGTFVFNGPMNLALVDKAMRRRLTLPYPECYFHTNNLHEDILTVEQDPADPDRIIDLYINNPDRSGGHYLEIHFKETIRGYRVELKVLTLKGKQATDPDLIGRFEVYGRAIVNVLLDLRKVSPARRAVLYRRSGRFRLTPPAHPEDGYTVVRLRRRRPSKPSSRMGGTHASPRAHTRRAHERVYSDGRIVSVAATRVNAGVKGKIDKAYLVGKMRFK